MHASFLLPGGIYIYHKMNSRCNTFHFISRRKSQRRLKNQNYYNIKVILNIYNRLIIQGKSYTIRSIRASQNGKTVFTCNCSFAVPEESVIDHQCKMPIVPKPHQIPSMTEKLTSWLNDTSLPQKTKDLISQRLEQPVPTDFKVKINLFPLY